MHATQGSPRPCVLDGDPRGRRGPGHRLHQPRSRSEHRSPAANSIGADRGSSTGMPTLEAPCTTGWSTSLVKELARRWFPGCTSTSRPRAWPPRVGRHPGVHPGAGLLPGAARPAPGPTTEQAQEGPPRRPTRTPPCWPLRRTAERSGTLSAPVHGPHRRPLAGDGGCSSAGERQVVILDVAGSSPVTHPTRAPRSASAGGGWVVPAREGQTAHGGCTSGAVAVLRRHGPRRDRPARRTGPRAGRQVAGAGKRVQPVVADRQSHAVRGDLEQVFRRHYGAVVAVAARVLGDRAGREDVAQEVFLSFGRSAVPAGEAGGWLAVAAAHTALNHLRSGRRRATGRARSPRRAHRRPGRRRRRADPRGPRAGARRPGRAPPHPGRRPRAAAQRPQLRRGLLLPDLSPGSSARPSVVPRPPCARSSTSQPIPLPRWAAPTGRRAGRCHRRRPRPRRRLRRLPYLSTAAAEDASAVGAALVDRSGGVDVHAAWDRFSATLPAAVAPARSGRRRVRAPRAAGARRPLAAASP